MTKNERILYKFRYFLLTACCLFSVLLEAFPKWKEALPFSNQIILIAGIVLIFLLYLALSFGKKSVSHRDIIFMVFAFGFLFRLVYVQSTGHLVRQHDVGGKNGHLEYIQRLYNGEGLPDSDVRKLWQFYQPPFWHILCAAWLKIQTFFGVAYKSALENLQILSLFFSSMIMLLSHKLFRMFRLQGAPLVIACTLVAFHPTFIILSGSINNDVMSLALCLLSAVLALKWYRNPKFSTIIALAFSLGISMGVKVSGGLISLGIAILFAIRLFGKTCKNKLNLVGQFASFGAICVPLALWWQFRNLIKFGVPLTYVPMLSEKNSQYIGFRTVAERLFDFSSVFEAGVYPARVPRGFDFYEYNIPLGALKSSVFGEYYLLRDTPLEFMSVILFWSAAILAVLSAVCAVYVLGESVINRKKSPSTSVSEVAFPIICSLTLIISYVKFCFDYAHFCTMDFRYIALTVVFGSLYLGLFLQKIKKNNKMFGNILVAAVLILTVAMSLSSLALYGMIG